MAMNNLLRHSQPWSQPDYDPPIQEFLKWLDSPDAVRKGCSGFKDAKERKYIPAEKLRERLTRPKVENLLTALFDNEESAAPEVDNIISHYLRPFAILLCIGEGKMIKQFVHHKCLEDGRLPLSQKPSEFPSSSQRDLWAAFHEKQWAFCALTLEYGMDLHIKPEDILPIISKEKIGDGGSSIAYKIVVDREYDKLVPLTPEHADTDHQQKNTYVLKTYRTTEAQIYYETEQDGYRRLKDDGMPPSNIIGCYGGFCCEETCNIILEFADLGNLDEYMEHTPPPSTKQEKMIFWDNFLEVINGLVKIHGEGADDPEVLTILLGWHQDVNPSNILVKTRGSGRHDCVFKLADLGLSHFEKHLRFLHNVTTQENYGTSTYAAPEARRYGEKLQKCRLPIKQNVDIWSLSCVFSEVATWVNKGWDQLSEYRSRRMQEMERKNGKKEDCFHDGSRVLTAVANCHADIIDSRRADDLITSDVVHLIRDTLIFKEAERPNAIFLYGRSRRIIERAKSNTGHSDSLASAATYGLHPSPPLKEPPNLPSDHTGHESGESPFQPRPHLRANALVPERSSFPGDNDQALHGPSRGGRSSHVSPGHHDGAYEQGASNFARSPPPRPASGHYPYFSGRDHGPSSSHGHYSQFPETHTILSSNQNGDLGQASYDSDPPGDLSELNHMAGFNQATRRRTVQNRSSQPQPYLAYANQRDRSRGSRREESSYARASKTTTATASGHPEQNEPSTTSGLSLAVPGSEKARTQLPNMSFMEGLSLKRSGHQFPHEMELKARDHAFLIDNGASMEPYRNEIKMLLELLWDMVAKYDPDGPDLYITTDMKRLKPKTDDRMLQELDRRPAKDASDMRFCFAQIIEKYQNHFGTTKLRDRWRSWKDTPSKGPRKLSLYVITDGVWQKRTDLEQVIRTLVDLLIQHKLTNKQIGIQFIRFGHDKTGMERLEKLDSGLDLALDIIDTTPAEGSIRKMLLGAINDTEDDDPKDDENGNLEEDEMSFKSRNDNATPVGKGKTRQRPLERITGFM